MYAESPLKKHRLLLLAVAVTAAVVVIYWQSFARMVDLWAIRDYQHGWLIYPLSLYVLVTRREQLASVRWQTSKIGLLFAVVTILVWLIAREVGVQIVEFLAITLLVSVSFWALAGTEAARVIAFPLLLLVVAVPMGDFLVEPLMRITAGIASGLLALAGIPVLRDGQFFELPGGSFEVADVCSGLRYLLAGSAAALAYSYVSYSSNLKRALFVGIVAIVLVVTNGVRAFIVMSVASATEMEVLGGRDHVTFGTVLFTIVFLAMVWVGERYADNRALGPGPNSRSVVEGTGGERSTVVVAVTLVLLAAGPLIGSKVDSREVAEIADLSLPELDHCRESNDWAAEDFPVFHNADFEKRGQYACGDVQIGVYVASYAYQEQGKELIAWNNRVWPRRWRRFVEESVTSVDAAERSARVRQVLVRHPAGWRISRYWYQVGPTVTSSPTTGKMLEALRALTLQPVESSIVVVTVKSGVGDNEAELVDTLDRHAGRIMIWNRERAGQGATQ